MRRSSAVLLASLAFGGAGPVLAQSVLYWDTNGATAGAGGAAPRGFWDMHSSNTNWSASNEGNDVGQSWAAGSTAIFAAGMDATDSYDVLVGSDLVVGNITYRGGSAGSELAITGSSGTLTLSGGVVDVAGNTTLRIDRPIAGTAGLTRVGSGALTLNGANTYSGGTHLQGGTLQVSGDTNLGDVDGAVSMANGATLRFVGAANPAFVGNPRRGLVLGTGGGTIDVAGTKYNEWNGTITGAGPLTVLNSDLGAQEEFTPRLTLSNSANSFSGGMILGMQGGAGQGRLEVVATATGAAGAGPVDIYWNSQLEYNGPNATADGLHATTHESTDVLGTNSGTLFRNGASAGSATLINHGVGSFAIFYTEKATYPSEANPSAGEATIVNYDGRVSFYDGSHGGSATITNDGHTPRGGMVDARGTVDLSGVTILNNKGTVFTDWTMDPGFSIGSLSGAGNLVLGDRVLTLGALNKDDTISGAITDTGPGYFDSQGGTYHPDVTATGGGITKVGTGTLTLAGSANTYTGATTVSAGTLRAGATDAFSAASAHTVAAGATLATAGFDQSIASLTNAGTVSLVGSTPGAKLTVTGAYVGQGGVLALGTALNAAGPSDRLVLDGASASASGHTTVQVTNIDGLGGLTSGSGIAVVEASNGATTTAQTTRDAFVLHGGHVDAGAYEYRLFAADADGNGENWYLRSGLIPPPPGGPSGSGSGGNPTVPLYRAEVPLLAALPAQLRQTDLTMLGNMHQRIGDEGRRAAEGQDVAGHAHSAWVRMIGSDLDITQSGTVSPASSGSMAGFQTGTDLFAAPASNWRAGVYVGQLFGDAQVDGFARGIWGRHGSNDWRSLYVGGYATYLAAGGFYADAVLQYANHNYTASPYANANVRGKGYGTVASIELGQAIAIGGGWSLEPQLQFAHQTLSLDDVTIAGATVQQDIDNGWLMRAGLRVRGELSTGIGTLSPYGRLNFYHGALGDYATRFIGPAAVTDIASGADYNSRELAAGFTLNATRRVAVYGEIGKLWSNGGDAHVQTSVQGSLGVKVRW